LALPRRKPTLFSMPVPPTQPASSAEQAFLDDLDKKLWNAADRLRSNLEAAVYKHAVLGLIFLKYVSDAFDLRREELEASFRDPQSDYFLDRANHKTDAAYAAAIAAELEDRDYYTAQNVFWVPPLARWKTIRESAALAPDTTLTLPDAAAGGSPQTYTFRSAARLIDDALEAVEKENPRLAAKFRRMNYEGRIRSRRPDQAVRTIGDTALREATEDHGSTGARQTASAFWHFYRCKLPRGATRPKQARVHRQMRRLTPRTGRERLLARTVIRQRDRSDRRAQSSPQRMRSAHRDLCNNHQAGARVRLTASHPSSFFIPPSAFAPPPFNISEWWDGRLECDPRWTYGTPPKSNANFAWVQHMLHHLAPHGSMALLLANGSMSSNTKGEGDIRRALVEADLVECMLALPGQLFTNTQFPACVWFGWKSNTLDFANYARLLDGETELNLVA
jgi:type I restriction enzyme M protein